MIDELKGKFNGMSIEINKKKELQHLKQVANLSTYPSRRFNSFYDDDDEESSIHLRDIISKLPLSVAITPDLPTTDSLIMGDEHLSTIPKKESDEFIKSSVEDLVPIPSESEDTSGMLRLTRRRRRSTQLLPTLTEAAATSYSLPLPPPFILSPTRLDAPPPIPTSAPTSLPPLLLPSASHKTDGTGPEVNLPPRKSPRALAAEIRDVASSLHHSLHPSGTPSLLPIPPPAPSASRRAEILEADMPPRKRLLRHLGRGYYLLLLDLVVRLERVLLLLLRDSQDLLWPMESIAVL
ncbi:hypothetical protein Tco_1317298 [Tanacetum coccineum]